MNNFIRAIRVSPPYPEQMGIRRYIKVVNIYDIPAVVIASYILFLFGFLFHFIGFVAPGWYNYKSGSDEIYGGLWKNCSHQEGCYEVLQGDVGAIRVSPPYPEQMGIRRYIKVVNIYDIPAVVIASYILFLFGFLFHFIGFVAPGWYNYKSGSDEIYGGLWKNCSHQEGCYEVLQGDVGGWLEATQTFQTLGFLVLLFTAAVFTRKLARFENKTDATTWLVIGLLFVSCFLIMLGFIIFAASAPAIIQKNVDYAFGMVIVAAVFLVLSANLFVVDAIK